MKTITYELDESDLVTISFKIDTKKMKKLVGFAVHARRVPDEQAALMFEFSLENWKEPTAEKKLTLASSINGVPSKVHVTSDDY